jgi:heme oxygenase
MLLSGRGRYPKGPPPITSAVAIRGRPVSLGNFMTQVPTEAMRGAVRAKATHKGPTPTKAKPGIGVVHRALRAATRSDHALIDRMLLPLDLSRAEDYRIFLNIHFAALVTLQMDWRPQDREDFEHMRRCAQADLSTLGCATAGLPMPPCTPPSPSKGLGVAYVIRGSRQGAALLRRGVAGNLPTLYLDFAPALSWGEFLVQLESIADDLTGRDDAIRAARSAFNTFAAEFTRLRRVISTPFS